MSNDWIYEVKKLLKSLAVIWDYSNFFKSSYILEIYIEISMNEIFTTNNILGAMRDEGNTDETGHQLLIVMST